MQVTVTAAATEIYTGLYNPHTLNGDIMVNGVKTSTSLLLLPPLLPTLPCGPCACCTASDTTLSTVRSTRDRSCW